MQMWCVKQKVTDFVFAIWQVEKCKEKDLIEICEKISFIGKILSNEG